jgi:hypothetical protein
VKLLSKEAAKMINKNLVGRCGHYCGACSIYRACEDGGELLEVMRKSCPPDRNLHCRGCQTVDETCWPYNHSKIHEYLNGKGLKFCYECDEFEKVDAKNGIN